MPDFTKESMGKYLIDLECRCVDVIVHNNVKMLRTNMFPVYKAPCSEGRPRL